VHGEGARAEQSEGLEQPGGMRGEPGEALHEPPVVLRAADRAVACGREEVGRAGQETQQLRLRRSPDRGTELGDHHATRPQAALGEEAAQPDDLRAEGAEIGAVAARDVRGGRDEVGGQLVAVEPPVGCQHLVEIGEPAERARVFAHDRGALRQDHGSGGDAEARVDRAQRRPAVMEVARVAFGRAAVVLRAIADLVSDQPEHSAGVALAMRGDLARQLDERPRRDRLAVGIGARHRNELERDPRRGTRRPVEVPAGAAALERHRLAVQRGDAEAGFVGRRPAARSEQRERDQDEAGAAHPAPVYLSSGR